jgi:hypothetical protein
MASRLSPIAAPRCGKIGYMMASGRTKVTAGNLRCMYANPSKPFEASSKPSRPNTRLARCRPQSNRSLRQFHHLQSLSRSPDGRNKSFGNESCRPTAMCRRNRGKHPSNSTRPVHRALAAGTTRVFRPSSRRVPRTRSSFRTCARATKHPRPPAIQTKFGSHVAALDAGIAQRDDLLSSSYSGCAKLLDDFLLLVVDRNELVRCGRARMRWYWPSLHVNGAKESVHTRWRGGFGR